MGAVLAAALLVAGCGGGQSGGGASSTQGDNSPDQYELAREIGRNACADPISPGKAASDPTGYAEEQFGGPDEFDAAREAGCLEALGG